MGNVYGDREGLKSASASRIAIAFLNGNPPFPRARGGEPGRRMVSRELTSG